MLEKHIEACNTLIVIRGFVHQVGYLLRLYLDARSAKHQNTHMNFLVPYYTHIFILMPLLDLERPVV